MSIIGNIHTHLDDSKYIAVDVFIQKLLIQLIMIYIFTKKLDQTAGVQKNIILWTIQASCSQIFRSFGKTFEQRSILMA